MLPKLRKRLAILYTLTTGTIFTIIMLIALLSSEKQIEAINIDNFQKNKDAFVYKMQTEKVISDTWLSQTEAQGEFVIHIEDNSNSLNFKGSWLDIPHRENLIEQTKLLALNDGIDATKYPVSPENINSSIFKINGKGADSKNRYYASVTIIPSEKGWKSLTLIHQMPVNDKNILRQRFIFITIDIVGILALFFISWVFIGKTFEPIAESRKRQTEFVAAASHELRSPLSVIRASASALMTDSSQREKFLLGIDKECGRMARLIDDMLILASADGKTWSVVKKTIETDTFLIEAYELFFPLCSKKSQKLSLELPDYELKPLFGDNERLFQALSILINNAMTYTPENGKITLRGFNKGIFLYIEVEDNGIGISDENKKHIFDRFYRVNKARNDKNHFGLGLSIANELVLLHGGKLTVKDTIGGGSTFTISF